jgi:hypothetical protein
VIDSDNGAEQQWFDDFGRAAENPVALDQLVAVVNDRIVEGVPELRDPTLRPELEASTRAPCASTTSPSRFGLMTPSLITNCGNCLRNPRDQSATHSAAENHWSPPAVHARRGAGPRSRPCFWLMEPPSSSPGLSV